MANLIEQLQSEALDESIKLSTLLRKVKLIASKLGLKDTVQWVDAELNGYGGDVADCPDYRCVQGKVQAFSSYHGWKDATGSPAVLDALSKRQVSDSISALEDLLSNLTNGTVVLPIDETVKHDLISNGMGFGWTDMHILIQRSFLVAIVDTVRTLVLNWALELEEQGITGEGVNFSAAEKKTAQAASISIENLHGNFHAGDISGVQNRLNQGSSDSSTNAHDASQVFNELRAIAQSLQGDLRDEVHELVNELDHTKNTSGFINAYSRFVEVAANTATLLPYVPLLAGFFPS